MNNNGWISTMEELPPQDARILIIEPAGLVVDATYGPSKFSPDDTFDGLIPNIDVKWWREIPRDGWYDAAEDTPGNGEVILGMGKYGKVHTYKYRKSEADIPETSVFRRKFFYWHKILPFPEGVKAYWDTLGDGRRE